MLAMPIFIVALAMPTVRMKRPILSFCTAKTCSTWARTFDFSALACRAGLWHGAARRFLAMDAADEAVPGQEFLIGLRAISRVGPNGACGVGFVEQAFAHAAAFIGRGVAGVPPADKTEAAVD